MANEVKVAGMYRERETETDFIKKGIGVLNVLDEGGVELTLTGDGAKTVLQLIKDANPWADIQAYELPAEPSNIEAGLAMIPALDTPIKVVFAVQAKVDETIPKA